MANNLEIILTLNDKVSDGLKKASKNLDNFSDSAVRVGRDIAQVGQAVSIFGAALTGPFILAIKNASKSNNELSIEVTKLTNVTNAFQEQIATAVLPILKRFNDILIILFDKFNQLPQPMKESILQGTLMVGVIATLGGGVTLLIGKMVRLIGNVGQLAAMLLTVNPLVVAIAGGIGLIIAAMIKWKGVADVILSTFEILFLFLENGFLAVKASIYNVASSSLHATSMILEGLSKVPGPQQEILGAMADLLENNSVLAKRLAHEDLQAIAENTEKIGEIFRSGEGTWSKGFQEVKEEVQQTVAEIQKLGDATVQMSESASQSAGQFTVDLEAMKDTASKIEDGIKKDAEKRAKREKELRDKALDDTLNGLAILAQENKTAAIAYKVISTGRTIISTARGIMEASPNLPLMAMIAAAGAVQLATIQSQNFAQGTDTVPANLSPGEMVFPSSMASAIRRGDITVGGPDGVGGGNIINIYFERADLGTQNSIEKVAEMLGFEIESRLRLGRSI